MTPLVLGIDGGGTKTILALADQAGRVVLHQRNAGIGPLESENWPAVLQDLMAATASYADAIAYGSFGMPSYGEIAEVSAHQTATVGRLAAFPNCILNDVHTAFEGAFLDRPGVLLLAGTGSMVWAGDRSGTHIRVGGWGHGFGDEGSAFWIGQAAIRTLSHCLDGREQDMDFAQHMVCLLGLPAERRAEALMAWYHDRGDPRVKVAALARAVDGLADNGNATAKAILAQASAHLALLVQAAWRRMPSLPRGVWSGVGGIMHSRHVTGHLARFLETPPRAPALPPIGGALWRAATNAGWTIDAAWVGRLRDELENLSQS